MGKHFEKGTFSASSPPRERSASVGQDVFVTTTLPIAKELPELRRLQCAVSWAPGYFVVGLLLSRYFCTRPPHHLGRLAKGDLVLPSRQNTFCGDNIVIGPDLSPLAPKVFSSLDLGRGQ
jgi:hypothetical protein